MANIRRTPDIRRICGEWSADIRRTFDEHTANIRQKLPRTYGEHTLKTSTTNKHLISFL